MYQLISKYDIASTMYLLLTLIVYLKNYKYLVSKY